jgi:hypothetical protein
MTLNQCIPLEARSACYCTAWSLSLHVLTRSDICVETNEHALARGLQM